MNLPLPGITPIVLQASAEVPLAFGSAANTLVLDSTRLKHPEDLAMVITELELVGRVDPSEANTLDLSLVIEADISVNGWKLTDNFVPIGLFDKVKAFELGGTILAWAPAGTDSAGFQGTTYSRWRLLDDLYIPQGASFQVALRRNPNQNIDNWAADFPAARCSFIARGYSLPPGTPKRPRTSVPWATAYTFPSILESVSARVSDGNTLINRMDRPAKLDYAIGKLMAGTSPGSVPVELRNSSMGANSVVNVKLTSSAWDLSPVAKFLPFNAVFCPQTDKLPLPRELGPSERVVVDLTTTTGLAGTPYLTAGVSLVGRRIEEVP